MFCLKSYGSKVDLLWGGGWVGWGGGVVCKSVFCNILLVWSDVVWITIFLSCLWFSVYFFSSISFLLFELHCCLILNSLGSFYCLCFSMLAMFSILEFLFNLLLYINCMYLHLI